MMYDKLFILQTLASNGANIDYSGVERLQETDVELIAESVQNGGGNLILDCRVSDELLETLSENLGGRLTVKGI